MAKQSFQISRRAFIASSALTLLPLPVWSAAPKRGGTFIMAISGEPATASAHLTTDTNAVMVATNLFSGLIGLDYDFKPVPDLAESWSVSPDGLVYTFNLVKNATWHDGKPVTAADVEFTFNEVIAKVHPRASSWWPAVASAKASGSHSFVITLKEPYAPFMAVLGNTLGSGTLILPKHVYQGSDPRTNPANQHPIGSGPFKFSRWNKGSYIELVRNDRYFGKGLPYLDRVIAQFMPDAASRLIAFEQGDVDFLNWYIVPYDQVARLRKDPRFKVIGKGGEGAATSEFLLFNLRNEHLKDVRVRQAIAHAVDREQIKAKALFGEGKIAHSFINSGLAWVFDGTNDVYRKPDPAKANALLDEAGFRRKADGKRFALRVAWASGREYEGRAAEIIRDNLRAVGIEVKIETFDRSTYIDKVFRNWDFDMAHQLFTTGPDPTISVTPRYHTKQIKKAPFVNAMGYSNPKLDAIFDTEVHEQDRGKRSEMWHEAQRILMSDLPALPIFEVPVVNVASAKFENVITGPFGYYEARKTTYQT
jgi:peptide/nickel transport system substrate-binding protein